MPIVGICAWDGDSWEPVEVDASGYILVALATAAGSDLLTELQAKLETADLSFDEDGYLQVVDMGGAGVADIGARVYHNADQSIANGSSTALALNSERYDTDSIHDTVTNNSRLTCKTAGKYIITATVEFAANATGVRGVGIRLNGSTWIADQHGNAKAAGKHQAAVATLYELAVNDYVEAMVYQTSGGALNVVASGNYSPEFAMQLIAEV